ncbi:MAG: choice-of-anchor D domain-containing protein [Deltaproteobacteria bacterium]
MEHIPTLRHFTFTTYLVTAAAVGCTSDGLELDRAFDFTPSAIDFGEIAVGDSADRTVRIVSRTDRELTVEVALADPGFTALAEEVLLPAGGTASVEVRFGPEDAGTFEGGLVISGGGATGSVALTGRTPPPCILDALQPREIALGATLPSTTREHRIPIDNPSTFPLTVDVSAQRNFQPCGGAGGEAFCYALEPGPELAPDGSVELVVRLLPLIPGVRERGELRLSTSETCAADLTFDSVTVSRGIDCSPGAVDFDDVQPGDCGTRTVTCENIANVPFSVTRWGLAEAPSPNDPAFTVSPSRTVAMPAGASVDIDVTFCPTTFARAEAVLEVESDPAESWLPKIHVPVEGGGCSPSVETVPESLDFGEVSVVVPVRRHLVITNVGFEPFAITHVLGDTAGTGALTVIGDANGILEPGEARFVTVEVAPQTPGPVSTAVLVGTSDVCAAEITVPVNMVGVNLPLCSFNIPPTLDFGVVPVGRRVERNLYVRTGASECLLSATQIAAGSDVAYSILDPVVTSERIPPNTTRAVRVACRPDDTGPSTGDVELSISSPPDPYPTVALAARAELDALVVTPRTIDFGTAGVDCRTPARRITIANPTAQAVTIGTVDFVPAVPEIGLVNPPTLPISIAPGQTASIEVDFSLDRAGEITTLLEIGAAVGGSAHVYRVELIGRADAATTVTETFEQAPPARSEILFVLERSIGTRDAFTDLGNALPTFLTAANMAGLAWRIGVTTTSGDEGGRLVHPRNPTNLFGGSTSNRILRPTSAGLSTLFQRNVAVGIGGEVPAPGIEMAWRALSAPNLVGANVGFGDPDASLSVVFATNGDDGSPGSDAYYRALFASLEEERGRGSLGVHVVGGDALIGCPDAGASTRYVNLAADLGGTFHSICMPDWPEQILGELPNAIVFRSLLRLNATPIPSTLRVFVDGVELPNQTAGGTTNWTYDAAFDAVRLSAFAAPQLWSTIRVEYTQMCL